ncbi:sulfotransferase [Halioxenophilus sp. WMMB6]|uniref:sulfotransferase family protein n=1 Tax=Halioxenophilus sp. WMMB6 TaxID=3073815 RepID=UPI00295E7156|nr:sulfotransferase [Halioxenophilus sp. WMMB6]
MSEQIHITDFEQPIYTEQMIQVLTKLEGLEIALDNKSLLAKVQANLDVPLHIDNEMLARFQSLYGEVFANGPLHAMGRLGLQNRAVDGIADVSRMEYIHATYPEVGERPIERPLIVAGMPRSGTTHLLKLLSSDPFFHTLYRWQTYRSFPSKAMLEGRETDDRRETGAAKDAILDVTLPHFRSLFDVEASDATEEIEVMAKACFGVTPSFQGDVPEYDRMFYSTDQTPAYRFLYRFLQAMQWCEKTPLESRWLLKSPQHLGALTAVNRVFPDACLVFTHRDPASVFTSLVTMIGYVIRATYSSATKQQIIDKTLRMQHGFLRGLVNDIDKISGPVEHIYFDQFMKNKQEAVARIYRAAGMEFNSDVERRVTEQAQAHTRDRRGKVVYDLQADFGLSRDEIRKEFAYYIDRFPVAIEESHQ